MSSGIKVAPLPLALQTSIPRSWASLNPFELALRWNGRPQKWQSSRKFHLAASGEDTPGYTEGEDISLFFFRCIHLGIDAKKKTLPPFSLPSCHLCLSTVSILSYTFPFTLRCPFFPWALLRLCVVIRGSLSGCEHHVYFGRKRGRCSHCEKKGRRRWERRERVSESKMRLREKRPYKNLK